MIKLGSRNGKNDKKITLLNKKRKKLKLEEELKELEEKEKEEQRKKDLEILISNDIKKFDTIDKIKPQTEISKPLQTSSNIEKNKIKTEPIINIVPEKKFDTNISEIKSDKKKNNPKASGIEIIEKEIINILEENIKNLNYELKKIDFDIHVIKKYIDNAKDKDELELYEKQINDLIEKINKLKKQLSSLEKTIKFDYPIEFKDNYLIYLVDEYKDKRRTEKELSNKIKEERIFESIVDKIISLEKKKDEITEKLDSKKDELTIQEDDLAKMRDEIINIDEISNNIKNMINKQLDTIKDIESKVSTTVHITEKVETITKSVKHSLLDLIILMNVFKHNINIKNNAACAVQAAVALELINKMCTPIKEQVTVRETDLKDYEAMIKGCMDDTNKLLTLIKNNQKSLSSIRHIFEKDFKEYNHLPNYKDIMNQLDSLDEKMEEAYEHTQKMNKEIEYQLEKNNAKVLKYGSI